MHLQTIENTVSVTQAGPSISVALGQGQISIVVVAVSFVGHEGSVERPSFAARLSESGGDRSPSASSDRPGQTTNSAGDPFATPAATLEGYLVPGRMEGMDCAGSLHKNINTCGPLVGCTYCQLYSAVW